MQYMYKLNFEGKHYEMGQKLGDFFLEHKTQFPIKLNKFQTEHGKESIKFLNKYFPEAIEEIKGITDKINYDFELFASWMMCMGCCLITRENHNVEVRGCTAFSFIHNNEIFYGRNNDLPSYLKNVSKSICYQPKNKNKFIINTSSFVNGEEGLNEYGLVSAMTFVVPKLDEIKPGFNSLFLVRYILENCKTVKEGINVLQKLPIASSCNILLTDKTGEMIVVECNPFEINLRYPEKNESGNNFIVTVNHFTSKKMQKHDRSKQNVYSSKPRYETAYNALKKPGNKNPLIYTQEILSGKYGFICQYKKIKFETIWSSVFDISKNKIFLAEGNPQNTKFIEDDRLNENIKNGT